MATLVYSLDANNNFSYPGSGSSWYDVSGNTYSTSPTMSLVNAPAFVNAGAYKYLQFTQAASQYGQFAMAAVAAGAYPPTTLADRIYQQSFSVSIWARLDSPAYGGQASPLLLPQTLTVMQYRVFIGGDTLQFGIGAGALGNSFGTNQFTALFANDVATTTGVVGGPGYPITPGDWHLFTATYEKTGSVYGRIKFYLDGILRCELSKTTGSGFGRTTFDGSNALAIYLNRTWYLETGFVGVYYGDTSVNSYQIYRGLLTDTDILNLYTARAASFGIPSMSTIQVLSPFPIFTDRDGQPLENGYVYIGQPNLDPQTNPVSVYFDEALTVLAAQPIRTINGYASQAGTPARLFIDATNYSTRVLDKNGTLVANSQAQPMPAAFTTVSATVSMDAPQATFTDMDATTSTITTLASTTGNITTVNATTLNATTLTTTGNTTLGNSATADTVRMNAYVGVGRSASTTYQLVVAGEDSGSTNYAFGAFNFGSTQTLFRVRNDGYVELPGRLGIQRGANANYSAIIEGTNTAATDWALGLFDDASANVLLRVRNDGQFQVGYTSPESPYLNTTGSAANLFISSTGVLQRYTSSIRYKTDVKPATFGLAEAMMLRPVTFKHVKGGDTLFAGFIAEEVEQAGLSVFVDYNDQGQPDALHYSSMMSLAIAAIKEQQQMIETLKQKVAALERKAAAGV
jgi:hypothetical protein